MSVWADRIIEDNEKTFNDFELDRIKKFVDEHFQSFEYKKYNWNKIVGFLSRDVKLFISVDSKIKNLDLLVFVLMKKMINSTKTRKIEKSKMVDFFVNNFGINFFSLEKSLKNLKRENIIGCESGNFYLKKPNLNISKSLNFSIKSLDLIFVVIFGLEKYRIKKRFSWARKQPKKTYLYSDNIIYSKYRKYVKENFYITFERFKEFFSVKVLNNSVFQSFNKCRKYLKNTIRLLLEFFDDRDYYKFFHLKKSWKTGIGFLTNRIYF
ncbi:hypothetical protein [Mycoplasma sp. CSL7503-lung]|uniref:hypothetical protein n=1 Tax=Mycoplasma sp. CSL7503-lung TaxID=536372 RepID=UPI0021D24F88|nr:hypothetical protein [Mycoplasma sp. CSL7503-lung]MCU4706446.1 hypothetical protein [Mycoplasma sp. CSL7503-lung]